jgi:hypothetical protein
MAATEAAILFGPKVGHFWCRRDSTPVLSVGVRQNMAIDFNNSHLSFRLRSAPPVNSANFCNSRCKPMADIPTSNQVSAPLIAKKQPFC